MKKLILAFAVLTTLAATAFFFRGPLGNWATERVLSSRIIDAIYDGTGTNDAEYWYSKVAGSDEKAKKCLANPDNLKGLYWEHEGAILVELKRGRSKEGVRALAIRLSNFAVVCLKHADSSKFELDFIPDPRDVAFALERKKEGGDNLLFVYSGIANNIKMNLMYGK